MTRPLTILGSCRGPRARVKDSLCGSHASIRLTDADTMPLRPTPWRLPRTARRLLPTLLLVFGLGGWSTPIPPKVPMPVTLFDFAAADGVDARPRAIRHTLEHHLRAGGGCPAD